MGERDAAQVVAVLGERAQFRDAVVGALAAQRVEREQLGLGRGAGRRRGRRGGALGGPAGRRDAGQPRGRRSYRHIRGDAAAAHSLFRLWEELPFLLRVALPVHLPLCRLHMSAVL